MDSIQSETTHMSIYLSSFITDNSHYNEVKDKFTAYMQKDLPNIIESYPTLTSNQERIDLFQKYFEWVPIPEKFLQRLQKSAESSTHFRETGNADYAKGQIPSALRSYNLAISFAPPSSPQQLLAYSNRSALLLKINQFKPALQDILRVEGSPEEVDSQISNKLADRRKMCEASLARRGLEDAIAAKKWEQGAEYCRNICNSGIKNPNKLIPGAEACVKMELDEGSGGRRLVAKEDIPAGTILLRDEPYISVLDGLLTWDTENCSTCTKPVLAGIPDLDSTFPMYCNEGCRSRNRTLPNLLLTYLHLCSSLHYTLLPLSVLLNSPESTNYENNSQSTPSSIPGIDSVYDPSHYSSVHNLVQHRQKYDFNSTTTSVPNEFKALFLSHLVSTLCPNLPKISPALLLKHLENLPYSQITLSTWRFDRLGSLSLPYFSSEAKKTSASISNKAYASGIFNLAALVNNSCDPNALFFKNCRTPAAFLLASKRILAGEEITMSYKGHWSTVGWQERKAYLEEYYRFSCACGSCVEQLGPESVLGCECIQGGEEDEDFLIEVEEDYLDKGVELINGEKYGEAFRVIVAACDALTRFNPRFQLCVVAQTLLRRVIVHLSML